MLFFWCSIFLILVLSFPRLGGNEKIWINGLYDSFSIIVLFPVIVYLGANGKVKGVFARKICRFLGDISYPIYITHYPLIYIYIAWVCDNNLPISRAWPTGLLVLVASIVLAYGCLKLYDLPVRKWLNRRCFPRNENEM